MRGRDDGVGGAQDHRQQEPPVPFERARLPVHADDIHLILQHEPRPAGEAPRRQQLGGAEERIVEVDDVEAASPRQHLRQTGGVAARRERRQLDELDAGRRLPRLGVAGGEYRHLGTGGGERPRLVIGDGPHAAAIGGKDGRDVRDSHGSPEWRRGATLRRRHTSVP